MKIKRFKIDKLIRDHVPSILREKGIQMHEITLKDDEFISSLKNKLVEEAEEVRGASNTDELVEELADILEIVRSLAVAGGFTMQQVEELRTKKRVLKGGFDKQIYSRYADIDEDNREINYFLDNTQNYPEIGSERYQSDCLFCQFARQERKAHILEQFQHCFVVMDEFPVSEGHVLIIPNDHTENWFTASEEVRSDIMKALLYVKERLDKEYSPQGYNIGANCGDAAGQSVMHLHVHLIPRYAGDMTNPKGGVRGVIPNKQKY